MKFAHAFTVIACCIDALSAAAQEAPPDQAAELAKKLQNPVASLISFPLQSNFDFRIGPSDEGWRYTLNIQPVIPISIGSDWNLIVRTIIPYIHQEDVFKGPARIFEEDIDGVPVEVTRGPRPLGHVQDGLGDTIQSFFFSPKEPVQRTRRRLDSCRRAGLSLPKRDRSFVGKRKMGRRAHWIDPQTNRRLDLRNPGKSDLEFCRRCGEAKCECDICTAIHCLYHEDQDYVQP